LDQARHRMHATFAPLQATVTDARKTKIGAKSKQHGKQEKKKHDELQHQAHAQAKHHHAQADAHRNARHDAGHDHDHPREKEDRSSRIQFKKISDWSRYMPMQMPDMDERERAHLLKLVKDKVGAERAASQKALGQLYDAQLKQAAEVRKMKPGLLAQISG